MEDNVIYLENHDNFKGVRGSLVTKDDMMEERKEKKGMAEIEASAVQTSSDYEKTNKPKGGINMEISPKEYIDVQLKGIEKSIDDKFDAQEKLFSSKIDHLHTKIEKTIGEKFVGFKDDIEQQRKDDRRFYVTTGIAVAAVVVALLGFVF